MDDAHGAKPTAAGGGETTLFSVREKILEASMNGIMLLTAVRDENGDIIDFVIAEANERAFRTVDGHRTDYVGTRLLSSFPHVDGTDIIKIYNRVIETGDPCDFEYADIDDGRAHWYRVTGVKSGDGVTITYSDITATKRIQEDLERLNQRLEAERKRYLDVFRQTPTLHYFLSADRSILDVGDYFARWIGYERMDLIGRSIRDFFTEESRGLVIESLFDVFEAQGRLQNAPLRFRHQDGHTLDAEMSAVAISEPEIGREHTILCVVTDVGERNRARYEASLNRYNYDVFMSQTLDLVIRLDTNLNLTYANRQYGRLRDKLPEEMIGGSILDFVLPENRDVIAKYYAELTPDNPISENVIHTYDFEERERFFLWHNTLLMDDEDNPREILSVGRDITPQINDRREIQDKAIELEQVNQSLQLANEGLRQFAYFASHDMQEPLRKIGAFGDILEQAIGADDRDEADYALRVIRESSRRASDLVSDLLSYSRATNRPLDRTPIDMRKIVQTCIEDLSGPIAANGTTFELDIGASKPRGDRSGMRQLVLNLISNAVKYRNPDRPSVVKISFVGNDSDGYLLTISDNGIGFEANKAQTIFEPFRRLHSHAQYTGTGIGLAISAAVARRHGWTIGAEASSDTGALFRLEIPASQTPETGPEARLNPATQINN